jgi:signal transduction histidine kinase
MDVKFAVNLYREVLGRYTQGFFMEELLGGITDALGAKRAVLFLGREHSPYLEARLIWGFESTEKERLEEVLLPVEEISSFSSRRYTRIDPRKISEWGIGMLQSEGEVVLLLPIRHHSYLRAALMVTLPEGTSLPERPSIREAAIHTILERVVEFFLLEEKMRGEDGWDHKKTALMELDILSNYLLHSTDWDEATSLSLDLLIKLFNMDGGSVHRVMGPEGSRRSVPVSSRGWEGMMEIIEHLLDNNLVGMLENMRRTQERRLCLDAARITEYFPGVNPYLHAHQVKSFLLTPLYHEEKLVGVLTLFGKSYTALEPKDMELLVQLSHRLGNLFAEMEEEEHSNPYPRGSWNYPTLVENLLRLTQSVEKQDDFFSAALNVVAASLGVKMAFLYYGRKDQQDAIFQWYSEEYGTEEERGVYPPELPRLVSSLNRISLVKPESPVINSLPAARKAKAEGLIVLLVPVQEQDRHLTTGFYLFRNQRFERGVMESLHSLAALLSSLGRTFETSRASEDNLYSLDILTEISNQLMACENQESVMDLAARGGRKVVDCDRAALLVYDAEGGRLHCRVETREGRREEDILFITNPSIARALEKGESTGIPGNIMVVPLAGKARKLGALVFENGDPTKTFSDFQRRLASSLAGIVAIALQSIRDLKRTAEGGAGEDSLALLSSRLLSSPSLEDMGLDLSKELSTLLGIELVLLLALEGEEMESWAWWRSARTDTAPFQHILNPRCSQMVKAQQEGKFVQSYISTTTQDPGEKELLAKGIRSFAILPLTAKGPRVGMLVVGHHRGGFFGEEELSLLDRVAKMLTPILFQLQRSLRLARQHQQLEKEHESLRRLLQTKIDLLNLASHEVRHPLTLITGFSEVLKDYYESMDDTERKEVAEKLIRASDRLRRSVINMMEVSQLESGKLSLHLEEIDLPSLLHGLAEEIRARASESQVVTEIAGGAESITADRDKLEIVLFNLLDNAVKFSPPGTRINVSASRSRNEAVLEVRDRGRGIRGEHLNQIFQPFQKVEGEGRSPMKGMGLGLYIVKNLVEAHGGRIEVKSTPGAGSTFSVYIPQPTPKDREFPFSEEEAIEA